MRWEGRSYFGTSPPRLQIHVNITIYPGLIMSFELKPRQIVSHLGEHQIQFSTELQLAILSSFRSQKIFNINIENFRISDMDVNAINQFLGQPSLLLMSNLISRCYNHRRAIGPPTAIPESASLVTNQLLFPIRVIKQLYRRGSVTNQELSCTTTERQSSPTFQNIEMDNSQQILSTFIT